MAFSFTYTWRLGLTTFQPLNGNVNSMGNYENHISVNGEAPLKGSFSPETAKLRDEVDAVLRSLSAKNIVDLFIKHDDGEAGKSAVITLRRLLKTELSLRGWTLNWKMFPKEKGFQGAPFQMDAYKQVSDGKKTVSAALKFGWDTTNGAGSNLVRADLLRTTELERNENREIDLYMIIAPVESFKERVNFDSNASTVDFYRTLSRAYGAIVKTPTLIMPMHDCGGFIVEEYKKGDRKLSKIRLL